MFAQIPIYAQYYDTDGKTIITKEIIVKDSSKTPVKNTGAHVTIEEYGTKVGFKYYPSDIRAAVYQVKQSLPHIHFDRWIFTITAQEEWYSYPIDNYLNTYNPGNFNYYKNKKYGIIVRDSRLPPVEKVPSNFPEEWIPF